MRPHEGEKIVAGDAEVVWRKHRSANQILDFSKQYAGRRTYLSVAYAACYVISDADRTKLVLNVGSDDQAKIYLNGAEVFRCPKARVFMRDQDQVANIALKQGANVLVFKVAK